MSEIIEYNQPSGTELLAQANDFFEVAQELKIVSPAMYQLAGEELGIIKARIKELNETRLSITRKFDEAKESVMALFRPALARLDEAKAFHERGMLTYNAEQERLRKAEQDRLDALAREEKARLEAEARAVEHEAACAVAKANSAACAAVEFAANAKGVKAKAAAELAAKEAAERVTQALGVAEIAQEEADALRLTSQVVVAATSVVAAPKATGTSLRGSWKGKCTDKLALLAFIVGHPEYLELVDVNQTTLNQLARSQKKNMRVDGCEAFEEFGITSRSTK